MCVFGFLSHALSPHSSRSRACILKWLKSTDAPTCPCCKAPALGDSDSPVDAKRESSPEADWWHT